MLHVTVTLYPLLCHRWFIWSESWCNKVTFTAAAWTSKEGRKQRWCMKTAACFFRPPTEWRAWWIDSRRRRRGRRRSGHGMAASSTNLKWGGSTLINSSVPMLAFVTVCGWVYKNSMFVLKADLFVWVWTGLCECEVTGLLGPSRPVRSCHFRGSLFCCFECFCVTVSHTFLSPRPSSSLLNQCLVLKKRMTEK